MRKIGLPAGPRICRRQATVSKIALRRGSSPYENQLQERACPRTRRVRRYQRPRPTAIAARPVTSVAVRHGLSACEDQIVGARVPANAVCQPTSMPQTHRNRGQARSYTGVRRPTYQGKTPVSGGCHIKATHKTCRSRLAGERGVSGNINAPDPPPSRASALLHRLCVARHIKARQRLRAG